MNTLAEIAAQTNFSILDWFIVITYPLISVGLGLLASRYISDMDDFVAAGRGVRTALGIATLTGTELGLVTVMYSAQKGFTGGFAAFHIGLAAGIVTFFVGLTGFIIGGLRREEVLTIPEYYARRYGRGVQLVGGLILAFGGILNMGMFLRAGSMFVVGITGLPEQYLIGVMFTLLVVVLFYTIMGGMISVVLADYVQFVVLSFGLLIATALAVYTLGWDHIFSTVAEYQGEAGFNPFAEEGAFGVDYVVWMLFLGLVSCALWPTSVARALAASSEQTVKRQFMFASLSYAIRNVVPYFWGIGAFVLIVGTPSLMSAFFPEGYPPPEATPEGAIDSLYAFPIFMGRVLPAGIVGIITAAMLAAFMSTHDSYFLCWSSVLANDVVAPMRPGITQKQKVFLTRFFILLIGIAIFVVSFAYPLGQDLWDYMAVTGAIYFSGAFALLTGGLYWKGANRVGAYAALVTGCLAVLGLVQVRDWVLGALLGLPEAWIQEVSSARVGIAVIVTAMLAMVLGSLAGSALGLDGAQKQER